MGNVGRQVRRRCVRGLVAWVGLLVLGCSPEARDDGPAAGDSVSALRAEDFYNLDAGPVNASADGVAVGGFDLVSYQLSDRAEPGSEDFTADFEGHRYRFTSAENRAAFLAEPERYLPAFGGFCAFGVGANRGDGLGDNPPGKYPVDPRSFKVIDGTLHLFYDGADFDALEAWEPREEELLRRANDRWEVIANIGAPPGA